MLLRLVAGRTPADTSVAVHSNLNDMVRRDERHSLVAHDRVDVTAQLALCHEHIAEAARRDERRRRPLALEHGVRRHRGAVEEDRHHGKALPQSIRQCGDGAL